MLGTVGGVPILGNDAIGEVTSPNVGVGEVTVLFVEIVQPKVAFRANGVGTLELFIMSFDASAAGGRAGSHSYRDHALELLRRCRHLHNSVLSFDAC